MVCSTASFDLYCAIVGKFNCTIGVVLRQCFSILFEFQVIRKGCIFSLFCHLSFYFFAPAAFIFSNYIVALRDDR